MPRLKRAFLMVSARADVAVPTRTRPANSQEKSFARMIISSPATGRINVCDDRPGQPLPRVRLLREDCRRPKKADTKFHKSGNGRKEDPTRRSLNVEQAASLLRRQGERAASRLVGR